MSAQTKKAIEPKLSIKDQMLLNAEDNVKSKKTLNESEAIKLVDKLYSKCASKNAMLKLIRSDGFSISMSRLFKVYDEYTKLLNADLKASTLLKEDPKASK